MKTLSISIREEDRVFIEKAMKAGRFASESEAVSAAIAELRLHESVRAARMAELRDQVKVGLDQLDRGEGAVWNLDEIKSKGRALLASRTSAA